MEQSSRVDVQTTEAYGKKSLHFHFANDHTVHSPKKLS